MAKKKLKRDGVYFVGKASEEVTGSQYLIRFGKYQCLLECGLHQSQSNSYLDSYKINSEKFKFKPSEIDFVFVAHPHIDHCGLIPRLVKKGFSGKIITTRNTAMIMKPLLLNSCYIIAEEAKVLSKKYNRNYSPLYDESDVYDALNLIEEYNEYNQIYHLNDEISFQWLNNSHCLGATQLQLCLNSNNKTRKIFYTSDIGALSTRNHFLKNTDIPTMFNDVVIMESTYGDAKRESKKTREFDMKHLKSAIDTVIERRGSVILPCFSFSRTQELLATLFDIYGEDEKFSIPIIVDSKLSCDISKLYSSLLADEDLNVWDNIYNWKNIKFISEKEDSQFWVANEEPKVVLSSSGFCTNGRIINYIKKYLPDKNSMIIFTGYAGDNPSYLSYRIKNYREHKFLKINKEQIKNNADCITLSTFSSHAGNKDLITYGSSLRTNQLILVHGSSDSKKKLSDALIKSISKNNNSYRVTTAFKDMVVYL